MKIFIRILLITVFYFSMCFSENQDSTYLLISMKSNMINEACSRFDIDANVLKSIIFVERSLNYDWFDKALDVPTALKGYNSSIGFCQVKMKTAYWIEVQLSDSTSEFYPGPKYQNLLPLSKSPRAIIKKLRNDSLNINYAAAYVKIIENYWEKEGFSIKSRADILGTLYSTGLYNSKGELRKPNASPKANYFGENALSALKIFK